jgi:FAD-dependent oxidoreductase domain-containing protein 1
LEPEIMEMTEDVIIIGGGVMGASAAYWLTRMAPGLKVLVVERDPTYARAATALSVASVRQQFSTAVNVRISRFGADFIRNFAERIGPAGEVPSLGLVENGYLFVTSDAGNAQVMREIAAMQCAEGAATEVWDPAQVQARFPWLNTADLVAGSFGPRDEGWFDNMGLLAGFRNAARARAHGSCGPRRPALRCRATASSGSTLPARGASPAAAWWLRPARGPAA